MVSALIVIMTTCKYVMNIPVEYACQCLRALMQYLACNSEIIKVIKLL